MPAALRLALLLLLLPALAGCQWFARRPRPEAAAPPAEPLEPSARLVLGRIIAVDAGRGFAFVELAADAPPAALAEGADLIVRTDDLRETGRLRSSRYMRGRTLGATIATGRPLPGHEVVWLAP